jgi:hypothetical protein
MYKTLVASTAAVLLTSSLANAQFLLGQNEFGHKQVRNLWAERSISVDRGAVRRFAGRIPQSRVDRFTTSAGRISPGFLLGMGDGVHKKIENQYSGYSWPR